MKPLKECTEAELAARPDWIQTFTNKRMFLLEPTEEMVCVEDIAHGLSNVCRFGGQCKHHYSVAQHSILVASLLPPALQLEGLLHDATEAYLGDMVRPLKRSMPAFEMAEQRLDAVIARKWDLRRDMQAARHIKEADNVALMTEHRQLFSNPELWDRTALGVQGVDHPIVHLDPHVVEGRFLAAYYKICMDRGI